MRILFDSEWQYVGISENLFKFENLKSRENGHQEVTLLSDAKYVCRETNIVVIFEWSRIESSHFSISLSRATQSKLDAGLISKSLIPAFVHQYDNNEARLQA